jgi:hypothetical protein
MSQPAAIACPWHTTPLAYITEVVLGLDISLLGREAVVPQRLGKVLVTPRHARSGWRVPLRPRIPILGTPTSACSRESAASVVAGNRMRHRDTSAP